uniref:Uncharacterized protein n=1 Tax=Romanomermis culicivorax TaxID=13658 RepID=A0A915JZ81_ROMCU
MGYKESDLHKRGKQQKLCLPTDHQESYNNARVENRSPSIIYGNYANMSINMDLINCLRTCTSTLRRGLMITLMNHLKIIESDFLIYSKAAFAKTPTAASIL